MFFGKGHGIISYSGSVIVGRVRSRTLVALTLAQTRSLSRINAPSLPLTSAPSRALMTNHYYYLHL